MSLYNTPQYGVFRKNITENFANEYHINKARNFSNINKPKDLIVNSNFVLPILIKPTKSLCKRINTQEFVSETVK
jgi:hypothetical protein